MESIEQILLRFVKFSIKNVENINKNNINHDISQLINRVYDSLE